MKSGAPEYQPSVDGRIIVKWILKEWDEKFLTLLIWFRLGPRVGLL
jgi:hypothetical protein